MHTSNNYSGISKLLFCWFLCIISLENKIALNITKIINISMIFSATWLRVRLLLCETGTVAGTASSSLSFILHTLWSFILITLVILNDFAVSLAWAFQRSGNLSEARHTLFIILTKKVYTSIWYINKMGNFIFAVSFCHLYL